MNTKRPFDGIICFGGSDWWYHNRGHYDLQMCRFFRQRLPVLYVNSIGVRTPSIREGGMFLRRVKRKVRSWQRGFVHIDTSFGVMSPFSIPGVLGSRLSGRILLKQVRRAMSEMGIASPIIWVECPTAAKFLSGIRHVGLVYQRTDRYEEFPGVDVDRLRTFDRQLKAAADVTLYCSSMLFDEEATACRSPQFVDHGVDYSLFEQAGSSATTAVEPADVSDIPQPRIGFVGGIDEHTFDPAMFNDVAKACPDLQFVLVGACSLPENWCGLRNVHLLGQRPYDEVASYMAACEVLIMPWRKSRWIDACNPVKLKEYLAVGRPVVSSPFYELKHYRGYISEASDAPGFVSAIQAALHDPGNANARRRRVAGHTWDAKGNEVLNALRDSGLVIADGAYSHVGPDSPEFAARAEAACQSV